MRAKPSAKFASSFGFVWAYTRRVMVGLACPRRWLTARRDMPADSNNEAAV